MFHAKGWAKVAALALALAALVAGGGLQAAEHGGDKAVIQKAICVLTPTQENKTSGVITFTRTDEGVLVEGTVEGLKPNQKHGFHIHQFGDISTPDGAAAGGHFNPGGMSHGAPGGATRHVGDLGNLEADATGKATYSYVDKEASLDMSHPNCIIGRGVIVHADPDDLTTQPTGNAGARIAQGVIGVAYVDPKQ